MPYKDPVRQKQAQQDWHERNKAQRLSNKTERKRRLGARVNEYKLQRGCNRCGYNTYASALEAHHIDAATKFDTIASMVRRGFGWTALLAELEQCEIVCANCHREEHANRVNWAEILQQIIHPQ